MPHAAWDDALLPQTPARAPAAPARTDAPGAALQRADAPSVRSADLLALQRAVGNAATARGLRGGGFLQTRLTLGAPGDVYEQEADRVARQVVASLSAPAGEVQEAPADGVQRSATLPDEEEEELSTPAVQTKAIQREGGVDVGPVDPGVESGIESARGGGQPLDASIRAPMESAFGADFSGVRVHTSGDSAALNDAVQARAFTTGQDVFFGAGQYDPGSSAGQELIAHELTHVVQQTPTVATKRR